MRCSYCERRCEIGEGKTGFCAMYTVSGGILKERFPHRWSSCGPSNVEASPFYHVFPGTKGLSIGSSGCNFRCRYCSNAYIAKEDPETQQDRMYNLSPRALVKTAKRLNCSCIIFDVNEPAVSMPSLMEVAREAEAASIPMGCLTNGYTTTESTELLASIFSFFNVGLKGLASSFTRAYIGIESSEPVVRNIRRLARDRHVEVTTPIIEGANDVEIDVIADFISGVDPEIPWHVFRLLPEDEMKSADYPNIQAIDGALRSARRKLPYLYFHNFVGSDWVNTLCPSCGTVVIERFSLGCGGDKLKRVLCDNGRCPDCGRMIKIFGGKVGPDVTDEVQQ